MAEKKTNKNVAKASQKAVAKSNLPIEETVKELNTEIVAKSLENIDTTIKADETLENTLKNGLKPIEELAEKFNEVAKSQIDLNEEIKENPEKAEEIIKNEINKAEAIKEKVEKILDRNEINNNVTSWWNGCGFSL